MNSNIEITFNFQNKDVIDFANYINKIKKEQRLKNTINDTSDDNLLSDGEKGLISLIRKKMY